MRVLLLRRDFRVPGPRVTHLPPRGVIYVRGGHVVVRGHHL